VFGTPAELALWGLDEAAATALAQQVWGALQALDAQGKRQDVADDLRLRGLALDTAAPLLHAPELLGSLLTLGQHLLAFGERGFRPWHVGIPDPVTGRPLFNSDLYDSERLATVSSYARYRSGTGSHAALAPPPEGAAACASCTVIVRGNGALAAEAARVLYASPLAGWPAQARTLQVDAVAWVRRDGTLEASERMTKRLQLADARRAVITR
jgi:thiamine biosynthesis lipoprotein